MTFFQALRYFVREACLSLVRSWKVSLVAVLTIMVSLFLTGVFLLVSANLQALVERWRAEARVVVYLEDGVASAQRQSLAEEIRAVPWTTEVELVTSAEARKRFADDHPSLADLLEGWSDDALPASFEVGLDLEALGKDDDARFREWLETLGGDEAVAMVDDDRDTLDKLDAVVLVIRSVGVILGSVLLLTAVFTISSVIRLTAYLYRDEIAVMRLVGATEFFIRGPFYMEGLLQGLTGGGLAILALLGSYRLLVEQSRGSVLAVLTGEALGAPEIAGLLVLGGLAGLIGAVTSLRREALGETAEQPEPEEDWAEE